MKMMIILEKEAPNFIKEKYGKSSKESIVVCGPYVVKLLNRKPVFGLYMARLLVNSRCQGCFFKI